MPANRNRRKSSEFRSIVWSVQYFRKSSEKLLKSKDARTGQGISCLCERSAQLDRFQELLSQQWPRRHLRASVAKKELNRTGMEWTSLCEWSEPAAPRRCPIAPFEEDTATLSRLLDGWRISLPPRKRVPEKSLHCLVLSCLVLSCLVLSFLGLSCLILSWFVLSCQTWGFGSNKAQVRPFDPYLYQDCAQTSVWSLWPLWHRPTHKVVKLGRERDDQ